MSAEENKALYRRWMEEVVNKGDWDQIDALFAPDFIDHAAPPGTPPGLEGVRQLISQQAQPGSQVTIEALIAEGDQVWARVVARNTAQGNLRIADMLRIANGKFVEHWLVAQPLP